MDVFRKEYKQLSPNNNEFIKSMKEAADMFYNLMSQVPNREMALAKTNLEQTIMWATKAIFVAAETNDPVYQTNVEE